MSYHFSYCQLYEAVCDGDVSGVTDALFFIGKERIKYNTLCRNKTALEIACEDGSFEVMELLLEELTDTEEEVTGQLGHLLKIACESGRDDMAREIVDKWSPVMPPFSWNQLLQMTAGGDVMLAMLGLDLSLFNDPDDLVVRLLDTILFNGNRIEEVNDAVRCHPKYQQWLNDLNPGHRAILFNDLIELERHIDHVGDLWMILKEKRHFVPLGYTFDDHGETIFVDRHYMDVFELAAKMGNYNLLHYLLYRAELRGADVGRIAESCCNAAVERGRVAILAFLYEYELVHRHYSAQWKWRLDLAVEFQRVDVAMFILRHFCAELEVEKTSLTSILNWMLKSKDLDRFEPFVEYSSSLFDPRRKRNIMRRTMRADEEEEGRKRRVTPFAPVSTRVIEHVDTDTVEFLMNMLDKADDISRSFFLKHGENVAVREKLTYLNIFKLSDVLHPQEVCENGYYFRLIKDWPLFWSPEHYARFCFTKVLEQLKHSTRSCRMLMDSFSSPAGLKVHEPFSVDDDLTLYELVEALQYLSGCTLRWDSCKKLLQDKMKVELKPVIMRTLFLYAVQISGYNDGSFTDTGVGSYPPCVTEEGFPTLSELTRRAIRRSLRLSGACMGHQDRVLALYGTLPKPLVNYLLYRDRNPDHHLDTLIALEPRILPPDYYESDDDLYSDYEDFL